MDLQLSNKRTLVTGSSAGIGKGIARKLAEEGASVVVTGRDAAKTETVAQEIRAATRQKIIGVAADLSTDDGAKTVADKIISEFGGIDVLVNNHGIYIERGWWNTTPADWANIFNQNVISFVRMIQQFGPRMREGGWGRIINISSGNAWQPFATMADYAATKAAILNLTVSLAKEFDGTGITVNTISPGIIVTETVEQYFRKVAKDRGWPDEWTEIEKRVLAEWLPNPSGRLGRTADIANMVALIASPLSGYMNGANYRVDGGSTVTIN
jgi:NAD(P)-dependent dehydrogenase (short-subunit alcohol dehydrogenase family)